MENKKLVYIVGALLVVVVGGVLVVKNFQKNNGQNVMMPSQNIEQMQEEMQENMEEEMQQAEESMPAEEEMMSEEEVMEEEKMQDSVGLVMAKAGEKELSVEEVYLSSAGYIVVHEAKDGKPGLVIGNSQLVEGSVNDVVVSLNRALKSGETVFVMLHKDDGDGEYEFPGDDVPVKDSEGNVVVKKVVIE